MHRVSNEADVPCQNAPINSANHVPGGLFTLNRENRVAYHTALTSSHNFISYLVEETAHRVRNPLTVVKGYVQLYKNDPQNIPWDLLLDEMSGIERTLHDLMILSRNYRFKPERVNLNQVIAELFPIIEVIAREQGVWIELYLDRSPVNIFADNERISALINQLLLNSLHAMPEGGILTIRTVSNKGRVTLQVTDSGVVGEALPNGESDQENLSFGLAICEHMVETLGGNINVAQVKHKGTIITVTIPRITG